MLRPQHLLTASYQPPNLGSSLEDNKDDSNISYTEGVEAILDDIVFYAKMTFDELRPHLKALAFHDLPDAKGQARFAGAPAIERLRALTNHALKGSPFARKVDSERAFVCVKKRFGETFIRGDTPNLSEDELRTLFEGWIATIGEDCRARTHIIPCDLALKGVDEVRLGPIMLRCRKLAWPSLEAELVAFETEPDCEFRQRAGKAARNYLEEFGEVAEIEVPDCDEPMSRLVASYVLQIFLDFIHVMAGAPYTKKMRGPGPALSLDRRSSIIRESDGRLVIEYSVTWGGANISEDGWRDLAGPDPLPEISPFANTLTAIAACQDLNLLADRFVDACGWYGDAAREKSPAAAAVKYVTVMERLLWTGERGPGVTRRVSERLAALCFSTETWDFFQIEEDVKDAYDLRSSLLHGRISKTHPDVGRRLLHCERNARELLQAWIQRFGSDFGLELRLDQLRRHLDRFAAEAREAARLHAEKQVASTEKRQDQGRYE